MASTQPIPFRRLNGLAHDRRGATAVEFAIICVPFLTLLFAIFELGAMFMASTTMDTATEAAARQIRTGQLQAGSANTAAGFKDLLCGDMSWISKADCLANASVDVRTFASFADVDAAPPLKNGAIDPTQMTFDSGGPCSIVLVRAYYPWTLMAPVLEPGLPDLGSNQRLLSATVTFRNENWQAGAPPCS